MTQKTWDLSTYAWSIVSAAFLSLVIQHWAYIALIVEVFDSHNTHFWMSFINFFFFFFYSILSNFKFMSNLWKYYWNRKWHHCNIRYFGSANSKTKMHQMSRFQKCYWYKFCHPVFWNVAFLLLLLRFAPWGHRKWFSSYIFTLNRNISHSRKSNLCYCF